MATGLDGPEFDRNFFMSLVERQHEALEQIMRRAVHSNSLDVNSARRALAEIYQIARQCRNVEGE